MNIQELFKKTGGICYGGDYNPEQWGEDVWLEDMRLMKQAGVNLVSVGIFSWALLQPDKDTYDFSLLDKLLDLLQSNGIYADLATATASPPAWLSLLHPEMLPVDEQERKLSQGARQHYCPNSRAFRSYGQKLVRKLAERYGKHPAVVMWHVNNELGNHVSKCGCPQCREDFRNWLRNKYQTLEALNCAWGTDFWSQRYYDWQEIGLPLNTPAWPNPCQYVDYQEFMSDSLLECYLGEQRILREVTPDIPVTTNFMPFRACDYFKWAQHVDIVSWDSYPEPLSPLPYDAVFWHDMMRSLKNGLPFLLMEQVTSQVNWRQVNPNKRPGIMRLWSWQAVARGADGVLFFQWRASNAGAEKYHGAMLPHSGEHSRIFREVCQLGEELRGSLPLTGSRIDAKVAILFDWRNWWAVEMDSKPVNCFSYPLQIAEFYHPLFDNNIPVQFVPPESDLSGYDIVIAPLLYMLTDKDAGNIREYVKSGGTFVMSFFSGIVDETDRVQTGGYPAKLRDVLGITVEEFDPLWAGCKNKLAVDYGGLSGEYDCDYWADVIHPGTAKTVARFKEDYYAGGAAVTVNRYGAGDAWYFGTRSSREFNEKLLLQLCAAKGVAAPLVAPEGVEVTCRGGQGTNYYFILNHNEHSVEIDLGGYCFRGLSGDNTITGKIVINAKDLLIITKEN